MPESPRRRPVRPRVESLEIRQVPSALGTSPRAATPARATAARVAIRSARPLVPPDGALAITAASTTGRAAESTRILLAAPAASAPAGRAIPPLLLPARRLALLARAVPQPMPVQSAPVRQGLVHLRALQAERTPEQEADAAAWTDTPIVARWMQITERAIAAEEARVRAIDPIQYSGPPQTQRVFAYMSAAVYDAVLAAQQLDALWQRPTPAELDPAIRPVAVATTARAGCPSTVAAASTAAAEVLAYLLPGQAASVRARALDAGSSQVLAGLNLPDDVLAGQRLGRLVARSIIVRISQDRFNGSEAEVPNRPRGAQYYTLPNPLEPRAGFGRPILLDSIQRFAAAVPPPPAADSPEHQAEIDKMMAAVHNRTPEQAAIAELHAPQPAYVWTPVLAGLMERPELRDDPLAASRLAAYTYGGMYDAMLAVWKVKYTYWTQRPAEVLAPDVPGTGQPGFNTVVGTPNFPSYISGHAAGGHAAAEIIGALVPDAAAEMHRYADEDSVSRLYAAVHWDIDDRMSDILGTAVGQTIVGSFRLRNRA